MVKAIVGAGGKTTLIKEMAEKYLTEGKRVFVTTSTHMLIEEDTLLTDDAGTIIEELQKKNYVHAGVPDGKKIKCLSLATYEKVCQYADVVLIEADGSKHMPLKFPNAGEPVIYSNVEEIVVVCGLHALGKRAAEAVHRLELAKQFFNDRENTFEQKGLCFDEDNLITAKHIQRLLRKGYIEPLREKYPDKKITICPRHNQFLYQRTVSALLKADIDVSFIKEEWFHPQPKLIICGGGHVSYELVKIAFNLDFYIKVIDDREEFADRERFQGADEVVCDSFEHLEKYLEPNAYYVVLTRGHSHDFECVKKILATNYRYLGMIGSRLKVEKTFENLEKEGISKEQLESIFAPIGLDIHAVTPAEIAISILAQIIQEKNQKQISSVSQELLDTRESGVLCIITEKTGSSPRGVGSMMLVTENKTIDSIGGGVVEYAATKDAQECKEVMIKEYQLNNQHSESLGMICGGSNKVLFIPI